MLLQWEPSEQKGVVYRIYANGTKAWGSPAGTRSMPPAGSGARADCYRVAAVDDQWRESPPSNQVCTAATTGVVTQR